MRGRRRWRRWCGAGGTAASRAGIGRMARPSLASTLLLLASIAACADSSTAPGATDIGAVDVASMSALVAAIDETTADPAVRSLRGVTVPYSSSIPSVLHATAGGGTTGRTAGLIGDLDLPVRVLGGTYARLGGTFVRDLARSGAPANGVRVLLYQRVGGVSTDTTVGFAEVVDSLRAAERRVTTALARAADSAAVVRLRSEVKLVGPVLSRGIHDVISGTVGRGATPIVVVDSFVLDSLTPIAGRNVVVATVASRGFTLVRSTPARPGASSRTIGLDLTLAGRTVHFEGSTNSGTGGYTMAVYIRGADAARVSTNNLASFGTTATTPGGAPLPQALREWLDAVGRLLISLPAAAEFSDAASNLVAALP